jgi:hypothetical protein
MGKVCDYECSRLATWPVQAPNIYSTKKRRKEERLKKRIPALLSNFTTIRNYGLELVMPFWKS